MNPTPAQIHQIAREERTRRKAAAVAAGQGLSDRAMQDAIIWSNIEHMAGRAAGVPACLKSGPSYWTRPEVEIMTRSARATLERASAGLDTTVAANRTKIAGLYHLWRWLMWPHNDCARADESKAA